MESIDSRLLYIYRYLTGNDQHPLVIYGAEGSGKTCLLARAAQQCHSWQQLDPQCTLQMGVVLRFVRLTPESSSILPILHSMTKQVSLLINGRLPRNPHVIDPFFIAPPKTTINDITRFIDDVGLPIDAP